MQKLLLHGPPSEDETAAVLAAITCVLQQEAETVSVEAARARPAWRSAALLEAQGRSAAQGCDFATWPATTRAARSRRWSKGIV